MCDAGHAQTSGVSSLDYYVSYRGFSEPQAQSHYSEQLLVVDGYTPLPRYYEEVAYSLSPHMATEAGQRVFKGRFGIPQDATVYACLQTLFKVELGAFAPRTRVPLCDMSRGRSAQAGSNQPSKQATSNLASKQQAT